jgi:phosphoribosylglycinamide formyltransferase-1
MSAIARACLDGTIAARVAIVVADRADAGGLASAADFGIPTAVVQRSTARDVASFEAALAATLEAQSPDAVALAGFMRILSAGFVTRFLGTMFNIHPSLLPAYRGLHTHRRVLAAHESRHGASVHFVTEELDGGPVVLQSRLAVAPADTEVTLAARVQATEHLIYPQVLAWFAQRRLAWRDGTPWLDGRPLRTPVVEDFLAPP